MIRISDNFFSIFYCFLLIINCVFTYRFCSFESISWCLNSLTYTFIRLNCIFYSFFIISNIVNFLYIIFSINKRFFSIFIKIINTIIGNFFWNITNMISSIFIWIIYILICYFICSIFYFNYFIFKFFCSTYTFIKSFNTLNSNIFNLYFYLNHLTKKRLTFINLIH